MDMSLLMSMMMGSGAALNGQPWARALDTTGQNALGASNVMKWMQQMLGQEGSKMSFDNKGMSMKVPMAAMQNFMKGASPTRGNQTGGGDINPVAAPTGLTAAPGGPVPVPGATMNPALPGSAEPEFPTKVPGQYVINPSSSPLAAPGLGGLTPEAMTNIYQTALGYKELERKKVADWLSYAATAQTNQLKTVEEARRWYELNREAPFTMPDGTPMSLDVFKSLPDDVRSYYAYVRMQRQTNPKEGLMPFEQWKNVDKETKSEYLSWLMGDPKRMAAAKELAQASGTHISIGEKAEQRETFANVDARTYFSSPKLVEDVNKYLNDIKKPWYGNPELTRKAAMEYVDSMLRSAGEVLSLRFEGAGNSTVVWTVKWKDGKTSEVKYAVGARAAAK